MKKNKLLIIHIVNLSLILTSTILVNSFFNYKEYTLYENGKWISSKTKAEKGLLAAWTMMCSKPAVSQNYLNISAWSGYQELIFNRAVKFETLRFRCKSFNHPFSVILDKTDSGSRGIYFNYKKDTCCFFVTNAEGKFTLKNDFTIHQTLNNARWNQIQCEVKSGTILISVNKNVCAEIKADLPDSLHLGFRGDRNYVFVDDVIISDSSHIDTVLDDFSPPLMIKWQSLVFLIFLSFLYLSLRDKYALNFILLNSVILMGVLLYSLVYFYYISGLYSKELKYKAWTKQNMKLELTETARERIKMEYPIHTIAGKKTAIVCIGSSQTWGSGVTNIEYTYPNRMQRALRLYFNNSEITVINTGIQGALSNNLLKFYQSDWINYRPALTIIDLSFNDINTEDFRRSIRGFIEINQKHHIKTLLVFEPVDTITESVYANHAAMKAEAMKANVPCIDMQSYMDNSANTGFLWWDYVHMTDYGYHLFSDRLCPEIIKILEADSSVNAIKINQTSRPR